MKILSHSVDRIKKIEEAEITVDYKELLNYIVNSNADFKGFRVATAINERVPEKIYVYLKKD